MPAAQGVPAQPPRKQPAYPPEQIDALVAYVASLGNGPPIPVVDIANADVSEGGVLYRANCAACHQSAGAGGAVVVGNAAPPLRSATAEQVVEAMRIGPGEMPVFNEATFSDAQADNISAYVQYLRNPDNRGGAALGGNGPVPEGLVALIAGLGGLVFISVLIVGRRRRSRRPPVETPRHRAAPSVAAQAAAATAVQNRVKPSWGSVMARWVRITPAVPRVGST